MFYSIEDETVTLRLKAQPSASKNEWCELYGEEAIKVRIKAPAVEGAANEELRKFIAKSFKLSKSDILFKTGQHSKFKIVTFPLTQTVKEWIIHMKEK